MSSLTNLTKSSIRLIGLGTSVAIILGITLYFHAHQNTEPPQSASILLGLFLFAGIASLMGAIQNSGVHVKGPGVSFQAEVFSICLWSFILSTMAALNVMMPESTKLGIVISIPANILIILAMTRISLKNFRPREHQIRWVVAIPALIIASTGLLKFFYGNLLTIKEAQLTIGLAKFASFAALPIAGIYIKMTNGQWSSRSFKLGIRDLSSGLPLWMASLAILALTFITAFTLKFPNEYAPFNCIAVTWIPLLALTIQHIKRSSKDYETNRALASLTPPKAKRFFLRHLFHSDSTRAATVGLRTATFVVDHDPSDQSSTLITKTLAHIRREEVKRFTERLLQDRVLHLKDIGNQLIGTIDPEDSNHVCLDVLILFASIYLDVVPLVERRLKGLASLFPMIDPGLSKRITPQLVEESHSKIEWLYHFDFQWVDQQLIMGPSSTTYSIALDQLNLEERSQILRFLQEKNRVGNFIWIGETARQRIKLEAPYLANIVEAWPLTIDQKEIMIYLMKFEELIPRLQKYYNLEGVRHVLRDFGVSEEAKQIISMSNIQFNRTIDADRVKEIVHSVKAFKWEGFQEKDLALSIILRSYNTLLTLKSDPDSTGYTKASFQTLFLEAIEAIGYPSQILHLAHKDKRAIRDLDLIKTICLDPSHSRFTEAWLFSCSVDPEIYSVKHRREFHNFLKEVIKMSHLRKNKLVTQKILESYLNFASHLDLKKDFESIASGIFSLGEYLMDQKQTADQFCMLLDGKLFLEQVYEQRIEIPHKLHQKLDQYIHKMVELGDSQSSVNFLLGRWKIIKQGSRTNMIA